MFKSFIFFIQEFEIEILLIDDTSESNEHPLNNKSNARERSQSKRSNNFMSDFCDLKHFF